MNRADRRGPPRDGPAPVSDERSGKRLPRTWMPRASVIQLDANGNVTLRQGAAELNNPSPREGRWPVRCGCDGGERCGSCGGVQPLLLPHLDERQRRLVLGAAARVRGHGGSSPVACRPREWRRPRCRAALRELGQGEEPDGRVRAVGGGRKRLRDARSCAWYPCPAGAGGAGPAGRSGIAAPLDGEVHPGSGRGAVQAGPPDRARTQWPPC